MTFRTAPEPLHSSEGHLGHRLKRRPPHWVGFLALSVLATLVFALSSSPVLQLTMQLGVCTATTVLLGAGWWRERRLPQQDPYASGQSTSPPAHDVTGLR